MERRDKRRFARADKDNDGLLDKVEFQLFIHPEESREMKDLVIDVSWLYEFNISTETYSKNITT